MSADDKTDQQNVEGASGLEPSDGVEIDKTAITAEDAQQGDDTSDGNLTSWIGGTVARRRYVKVAPLVLVLLLVTSGALAAWLYVK
jgi:Mce-associated membrane protein